MHSCFRETVELGLFLKSITSTFVMYNTLLFEYVQYILKYFMYILQLECNLIKRLTKQEVLVIFTYLFSITHLRTCYILIL